MEELLQQSLNALRPETLGDFMAYGVLILSFLGLIFLPDRNATASYFLLAAVLLSLIDLLRPGLVMRFDFLGNDDLPTFFIHVGMFLFPALAVGAARDGKGGQRKAGLARMVGIIAAVIGVLYTIAAFAQPGLVY